MPHAIPLPQASAQGDPAPTPKTPRLVPRQKMKHFDHLEEIKLDFQHFPDGQPSEFDHLGKSPRKTIWPFVHLAAFSFLRSNSHVFEFSTSGHLVVHLAI
jgi:hypothetical protein